MYEDLNKRQIDILNYLKYKIRENGYPPSVREICKAVHLNSTSTVHGHLKNLEEKGYIRRDPLRPRAIAIIDQNDLLSSQTTINVPVVGKVTAGKPILAVENIEEILPLPASFIQDDAVFMLSVKGESMINAGIFDGDYVVVRQQQTAENGEIVVAMIENEATVNRFFKEKGRVRLQPENPNIDPIYSKNVVILGKVIALLRKI
jgi:repressor LexA